MEREFSAGGIVLREAQDKLSWEVLLIKNAAMRDKNKAYWGFPKGHINPGEKSEAAAIREIKEETGIEAEIIKKLGDSRYIFTKNGEKVFKVVVYFLVKYLSGELKPQDLEVLDIKWVEPEEALKLLSFKKDKEMLQKALGM